MDRLIYDRTAQDVKNNLPKGQYNASDLNRVESWCRYLQNVLNEAGYKINIETKINWKQSDMRYQTEMDRILNNIIKIMRGFTFKTKVYDSTTSWNWNKANRWEKVLSELYNFYLGASNDFVYCGVANCGQARVWQARWRHLVPNMFTPYNWIMLANNGIIYWTDFNANDTWEGVMSN